MTLADTPMTWTDPPPMSTLHGLLFFGGIPLLVFVTISLLVMAPSLARGPRYRPGQGWDAAPVQFGALPSAEVGAPGHQLEAGSAPGGRERAADATGDRIGPGDDITGGASVSW